MYINVINERAGTMTKVRIPAETSPFLRGGIKSNSLYMYHCSASL